MINMFFVLNSKMQRLECIRIINTQGTARWCLDLLQTSAPDSTAVRNNYAFTAVRASIRGEGGTSQ